MFKVGIVTHINTRNNMVAIKVDNAYTIVELLNNSKIEIGDQISWKDNYALGLEKYTNVSRETILYVYVQNHDVSKSNLKNQLLL